ncbi:MAG: RNA methyltransferase [Salibacteraceae bacterium]
MNRKLKNADLQRSSIDEYKLQDKFPVKVVLDDIRSLANVGSVFRTSDAFRVEEILLCGITGRPPHRDIQRTALGATESVSWTYEEDACEALMALKALGYKVIAVEQCERSVNPARFKLNPSDKLAVVFGNEVEGVRQSIIDLADEVFEIPQSGTKHSLNVTVAAGIVLWELYCNFEAMHSAE